MEKLKSRADFNRVYRKGRSVSGNLMYLKFVENNRAKPRFKVVVSKKISKSAVVRNRNRRRLDEIIGAFYPKVTKNVDGIFFVLKNTNEVGFKDLSLEVKRLAEVAGLFK